MVHSHCSHQRCSVSSRYSSQVETKTTLKEILEDWKYNTMIYDNLKSNNTVKCIFPVAMWWRYKIA